MNDLFDFSGAQPESDSNLSGAQIQESTGKILGRKLRDELKRQNITVGRAAKRARMTYLGLSHILTGKIVSPKIDTLRAICAVVGVSLASLVRDLPVLEAVNDDEIGRPGCTKINEKIVRKILDRKAKGQSAVEASAAMGLSYALVKRVFRGATWKHVARKDGPQSEETGPAPDEPISVDRSAVLSSSVLQRPT